jgi:hypothetical protein
MAGTCKENGWGSGAKEDDGTKTVYRTKERKTSFEMDDVVADLKVMKIKQWIKKTKNREQRRLVVEESKAHAGIWRREEGIIDSSTYLNRNPKINFSYTSRVFQ